MSLNLPEMDKLGGKFAPSDSSLVLDVPEKFCYGRVQLLQSNSRINVSFENISLAVPTSTLSRGICYIFLLRFNDLLNCN